ncbi:MAG: Hsp20/alpha crystallin family protein [Ideonella sp.]|jgi:HSP20 family protein|nr:Hsp20/alpha crystallin family protein [Ideonella sp.]
MLHRRLFHRDLLGELDRLTHDLQQTFEPTPAIRGVGRGGYPALNVGATQDAVEIFAFAPGLNPADVEVQLDRGVLTISGVRTAPANGESASTAHVNERFGGAFRRVISLPDDIDPNAVSADYRDGVLHVRVKRSQATRPRRIEVH